MRGRDRMRLLIRHALVGASRGTGFLGTSGSGSPGGSSPSAAVRPSMSRSSARSAASRASPATVRAALCRCHADVMWPVIPSGSTRRGAEDTDESPCGERLSTGSTVAGADHDGGMTIMRRLFHERLDELAVRLDEMVVLVGNAMRDATAALFTADRALAELVLDGHDELRTRQAAVDEIALELLARQQPVAGDLRAIVACLRMSVDLRRMGRIAAHVAEIARDRDPEAPVPELLWEAVRVMSERALAVFADAAQAVATRNAAIAGRLAREDDEVDRSQQDLYRGLLAGSLGLDTETVVDLALIGRYYERFADHAVDLGRDIGYLTGNNALDAPTETRLMPRCASSNCPSRS